MGLDHALRQRLAVHREAVVHRGDLDPAGLDIAHGVVRAVMTVTHLDGPGTKCQRQHLMAQADTEDRQAAFQQRLDHRHRIAAGRRRIAGTVGQENTLGVMGHDLIGGRGGGQHGDIRAMGHQRPQNVALGAVIQRDDLEGRVFGRGAEALAPFPTAFRPAIGLRTTDPLGQIEPDQPRPVARLGDHGLDVETSPGIMAQHDMRRALTADRAGQAAGIHAADTDPAAPRHPVRQVPGRTPVRRLGRIPANHDAAGDRIRGLVILGRDAGIADMGEGEGDDLAGIGGIGHDFLIAGHRGIEDQFGQHLAGCAEALTVEDRPVGKHEAGGRFCSHGGHPLS